MEPDLADQSQQGRPGEAVGAALQHIELGAFDIELDEVDGWNLELRQDLVQRADVDRPFADDDAVVPIEEAIEVPLVRAIETGGIGMRGVVERLPAVLPAKRARNVGEVGRRRLRKTSALFFVGLEGIGPELIAEHFPFAPHAAPRAHVEQYDRIVAEEAGFLGKKGRHQGRVIYGEGGHRYLIVRRPV